MASNNRPLTFQLFGKDVTASKTMRRVGSNATAMGKKFRGVGASMAAGLGIGTLSLAALSLAVSKFAVDSVKAASDAETQQAKLTAAWARFPKTANLSIDALRKFNSTLEMKVGVDDDVIASGQATLAQFNLSGKQIRRITPLLVDYAKRVGTDVPSAAKTLGKAVLGSGKALKQVGINFKDTKSAAGNFKEIMAGLSSTVGGFASQQAQTAAGKLEVLKTKFGEVQEKVGAALLPALDGLVTYASTSLIPALDDFAGWFTNTGLPAIQNFVGWIVQYQGVLGPAAVAVGVLTAAMWLLDIAMDANPVGAIVLAIEAVIAIVVLAATHMNELANFTVDAMKTVAGVMYSIAGAVGNAIDTQVNAWVDALNFLMLPLNQILSAIGQAQVGLSHLTLGSAAGTVGKQTQKDIEALRAGANAAFPKGSGMNWGAVGSTASGLGTSAAAHPNFGPLPSYGGGSGAKLGGGSGGGGGGGQSAAAKAAAARKKALAAKKAAFLKKKEAWLKKKKDAAKKKASAKKLYSAAQVGDNGGARHSIDGKQKYDIFIPGTVVNINMAAGSVVDNENKFATLVTNAVFNAQRRGMVKTAPKGRKK